MSERSVSRSRAGDVVTDAACRCCGHSPLRLVLDYGEIPIADILLTREQLAEATVAYPMTLAFCESCATLQLTDCPPMELMYGGDYRYYSSQSQFLIDHYGASARNLIRRYGLGRDSLVIEVASNDGYMLQTFLGEGVPVLGIDPAKGPAAAAREKGIPTIEEFFDRRLARRLAEEGRSADLVTANNLINLLPAPFDLVEGLSLLLKPGGAAVFETTSQVRLIADCVFDMIYHANLCYFSLTAYDRLFRRGGLYVNHIEETPVFGGSLRIYVEREDRPSAAVTELLRKERELGVDDFGFYRNFGERVEQAKRSILDLLRGLKAEGKTLAVYGAAGGMATTLMNYLRLDGSLIDLAVDNNPKKQGLYMPVNHLQIEHPRRLLEVRPDYTLLLSWNYLDEVLAQQAEYRQAGGKFVVPLPELKVV